MLVLLHLHLVMLDNTCPVQHVLYVLQEVIKVSHPLQVLLVLLVLLVSLLLDLRQVVFQSLLVQFVHQDMQEQFNVHHCIQTQQHARELV